MVVITGNELRVFEWNGQTYLARDSPPHEPDLFAGSMALSRDGRVLVVGTPFNHDFGTVQVFQLVDDSWEQLGQKIIGLDGSDGFGYDVSVADAGDTVAIGATYSDQAFVFRLVENGGSAEWEQLGSTLVLEFPCPCPAMPRFWRWVARMRCREGGYSACFGLMDQIGSKL